MVVAPWRGPLAAGWADSDWLTSCCCTDTCSNNGPMLKFSSRIENGDNFLAGTGELPGTQYSR